MKLDVRAAALATGGIAALAYTICTVLCVVLPESTVAALGTALFHVDLTGLYRQITWGIFLGGLLGSGVGMAAMAGSTAWLYNRLARTETETSSSSGQRDFAAAGRAP